MSDVNVVRKSAGSMLNDSINKYFYILCMFLGPVWELNCRIMYAVMVPYKNLL
jgi:hypothetical protein